MRNAQTERDAIRQALVDGMGYEEEVTFEDEGIEAGGISADSEGNYCLSIMVARTENGMEVLLTEKELRKALNAIKKVKGE